MPELSALIPTFLILIASLSFHEAAHAWTANRLGDPTARQLGRLTLNPIAHIDPIGTILFPLVAFYSNLPLIGWAKPVPVNVNNLRAPRRDFAIVALAGPVSNLLIAVACALPLSLLSVGGEGGPILLARAVILNVFLAVFNLIPVPPLDGGNVLAGVVPESAARLIDAMRPWGFLLLYVMMFMGVLDVFVRPIAGAILDLLL